jgi:hypothetical protein
MYPKAYLFHNSELQGLEHLISSPVTLTFNARQINANQKAHKDIFAMLALYNASNKPIYPKFITSIYDFKQQEMLATILKFGITDYCYIKSDEHFALAKSLVNISKKLEPTMQNISGLESNMRSCYKSLVNLNLQRASPMDYQEIESLSHALSVRKVARLKLNDLIRSEFIADIC